MLTKLDLPDFIKYDIYHTAYFSCYRFWFLLLMLSANRSRPVPAGIIIAHDRYKTYDGYGAQWHNNRSN